jgi:hypothetical protein
MTWKGTVENVNPKIAAEREERAMDQQNRHVMNGNTRDSDPKKSGFTAAPFAVAEAMIPPSRSDHRSGSISR